MNHPRSRDCTPAGVLRRCPRLVAHVALLMGRRADAAAAIVAEAASERASRMKGVRRPPFATRMLRYAIRFREYHRDMREVSLALCLERIRSAAEKAAA